MLWASQAAARVALQRHHVELADGQRRDRQAGPPAGIAVGLLHLGLDQVHVVGRAAHVDLHAVDPDLPGQFEGLRVAALPQAPVASADLETARGGRGQHCALNVENPAARATASAERCNMLRRVIKEVGDMFVNPGV